MTRLWTGLRADRIAFAAGLVLAAIVLACFAGAPLAAWGLGHGPNQYFAYGATFGSNSQLDPVGPFTWVADQPSAYPIPTAHTPRTLFILGGDGPLGRDELLRLLYGGRSSLEIAIGATLVALLIGTLVGTAGGYFGGAADAIGSTATDFVAAFPLLLLVTAIGWTISARLNDIRLTVFPQGVVALILMIGSFTWPYPARIVRTQVLALREREFVEAAHMLGAGGWRTIRTHLLPHLWPTLIVYSSLILAANVVLEAALSALNLGLQSDAPDWGTMLSQNWGTLIFNAANGGVNATQGTVWTQALPAAAVLLTIVALALLGDGLRKALDPRGGTVR